MPELPEVETVVQGLKQSIKGKQIKSASLFWPAIVEFPGASLQGDSRTRFSNLLVGVSFSGFERHGKYLKLTTERGVRLVVHLRMTGQLFISDSDYQNDKHVHLEIVFNDNSKLIYRDIRKFGRWIVVPPDKNFEDYINAGEDALTLDLPKLKVLIKKYKHRKLKAFLLDQLLIAGIGNIYADEICFNLKTDPEFLVGGISASSLHKEIGTVLKLAIKNKGTSVSDYLTSTGAKGNFQNLLNVYKQKNCNICGGEILRKKVAGRTSHYCPRCQSLTPRPPLQSTGEGE